MQYVKALADHLTPRHHRFVEAFLLKYSDAGNPHFVADAYRQILKRGIEAVSYVDDLMVLYGGYDRRQFLYDMLRSNEFCALQRRGEDPIQEPEGVKPQLHRPPISQLEQYQDIWVKGKVEKKGVRECEDRFEIIQSFCKQYTRPFTILDIGANLGYFSLRLTEVFDCTAVAVEGIYGEWTHEVLKKNENQRVILLQKVISLEGLCALAAVEHFDVVLALSVIHHLEGSFDESLNVLRSLGDHLILELPYEANACGQEVVTSVLNATLPEDAQILGYGKSHLMDGERPIMLLSQPKQSIARSYLGTPRTDLHVTITSTFDEKKVRFHTKEEERTWARGINLQTYLWFKGVYPSMSRIADLLAAKRLPQVSHRDIQPWNVLVQGDDVELIDANDPNHAYDFPDTKCLERLLWLLRADSSGSPEVTMPPASLQLTEQPLWRQAAPVSSDVGPQAAVAAVLNNADRLIQAGKLEQAVAELQKGFQYFREAAKLHFRLYEVMKAQGQTERAEVEFATAFFCDPSLAEVHNEFGVRAFEKGNIALALRNFERAVQFDRRCVAAQKNLSDLYVNEGRPEDAVRHLQAVLEYSPDDVEALAGLGYVCVQMKSIDDAMFFFNRVIAIRPDHPEVLQILRLLDAQQNKGTAAVTQVSGQEVVSSEVVWAAPFFNPSGYASEAINFVLPLERRLALKIFHHNHIVSKEFIRELPVSVRESLDRMQNRKVKPEGFIFVSHNPAHGFVKPPEAKYVIGRTMFETDRIPHDWVVKCNEMDEVWVPTDFNMQTFARCGVEKQKLKKIPGSVDVHMFDPRITEPLPLEERKGFNFLAVFEWSERKGYDVLLKAYFSEFHSSDDVALYLRTYLMGRTDADDCDEILERIRAVAQELGKNSDELPAIRILNKQVPLTMLPMLYKAVDAFVAPSRGEGWGRPHMEAMAMELPCIATNWSGNTEFMNESNSYPLRIEGLRSVRKMEIPIYVGHKWAEPSVKHLRQLMRHVQQHREEARQKGVQARRDVVEKYSQEKVAGLVMERIVAIQETLSGDAAVRKKPSVAWEGTPFAHHSLSLINRELCVELLSNGYELSIVPFGEDHFKPGKKNRFARLHSKRNKLLPSVDVHVRHHWPPNLTPPEEGRWVVMQPWEFGSLPKSWVEAFASQVDEVWAYTEYVRQVYVSSGIPANRVHIVPPGFDPETFHAGVKPLKLKTKKQFKFLFVGGTIYRKGIDILLETYTQTFTSTDDVCLVIKDMGGDSFYKGQTFRDVILELRKKPGMPEIEYIDKILSEHELAGLYTACNVLVHPYRGEGFGMPILESMACGTPAIVTQGGAALDFCNRENSILVSASRLQLPSKFIGHDETVDFPWLLEVNKKELAEKMAFAMQHVDDLQTLGKQASEDAHSNWTWRHAAAKCRQRIDELSKKPIVRFSQQPPGNEYMQEKLGKSLALFRLGRFKDSLAELLDPGPKVSENVAQAIQTDQANLKGACYLRLNDLEKAKVSFEEALNLTPDSSEACAGLGEVFYLLGKDKEAKIMFEYAVVYDEENVMAVNGLAKANENLGLPSDENSLVQYVTVNK